MGDESIGERLRERRRSAGLSQRELAVRSGIPQPNIAAYESGRRSPAAPTLERLDDVLRTPTLDRTRAHRHAILDAANRRHLTEVRIFGSVARGDAGPSSDVDLLVRPGPSTSLFDLAGFMLEVQELLGTDVDVVSDRGSGPTMDRILAEAVPL